MRILFLAFDFPYPPDSGGRIKTFSILDYLRDSGHQVSVVCFRRRPLSAEQGRWAEGRGAIESVALERGRSIGNLLRSYANRVPLSIERNRSEKMKELVRRRTQAGAFDRLFVDGWMMAQYVPEGFRGRTILHEHNAEYVLWRRQAQR